MKSTYRDIHYPLENLRLSRGISLSELAINMSVSETLVEQWEKGAEIPSAEDTFRLSMYLKLPLKDVYLAIIETLP